MINSLTTIENKNRNVSSNKIIINLEELNINELRDEEENNSIEIGNEIIIQIDKEKETNKIIDKNFEDINKYNIYGGEKLIKPILVW